MRAGQAIRTERSGAFLRGEATHVAMKVADARDVEGRLEHDEDEQACYVPLRAGGPRTRVYRASEVPDLTDDWIWTGRLQTGHVTALVGPKGAGKSFLIAEIAARLSNGDPWPDDPLTPCEMAETLIITGEDEIPTVIKRRLRKCNADLENVHVVDFRDEDGTPGVITAEVVEEMADSLHGLKLIVIDPIDDFLGTRNERRLGELRILFHQLARLAASRGIAIIVVNATDKISTGKIRQYGVDLLPFLEAGARAVWTLEKDPANDNRFLWLQSRSNLAPSPDGLAFSIDRKLGTFQWDPEPVELKAEDLQPVNRRVTKVAGAADWLREYLEDGARTARAVRRDAALQGISRGALYEAKGRLGVRSDKGTDQANGSWAWSLPAARGGGNRRFPQIDANFLRQFAEKLRRSCDPVATPAGGSGGGGEAGPECGDSPQDSKILAPVNVSEERADAAEGGVGRPTPSENGEESGVGGATPELSPECGDLPQDSKILTPVNAAGGGVGRPTPSTNEAEGGIGGSTSSTNAAGDGVARPAPEMSPECRDLPQDSKIPGSPAGGQARHGDGARAARRRASRADAGIEKTRVPSASG